MLAAGGGGAANTDGSGGNGHGGGAGAAQAAQAEPFLSPESFALLLGDFAAGADPSGCPLSSRLMRPERGPWLFIDALRRVGVVDEALAAAARDEVGALGYALGGWANSHAATGRRNVTALGYFNSVVHIARADTGERGGRRGGAGREGSSGAATASRFCASRAAPLLGRHLRLTFPNPNVTSRSPPPPCLPRRRQTTPRSSCCCRTAATTRCGRSSLRRSTRRCAAARRCCDGRWPAALCLLNPTSKAYT